MAVSLYRVLIDTSVWLDMAGSYRAAPLVRALHEMCDNALLEIIVTDIVRAEFSRNKNMGRSGLTQITAEAGTAAIFEVYALPASATVAPVEMDPKQRVFGIRRYCPFAISQTLQRINKRESH